LGYLGSANRLVLRSASNNPLAINAGPGGAAWDHPWTRVCRRRCHEHKRGQIGARVEELTETGLPLRFLHPSWLTARRESGWHHTRHKRIMPRQHDITHFGLICILSSTPSVRPTPVTLGCGRSGRDIGLSSSTLFVFLSLSCNSG
jgi:hypothetical protein